MGKTDVHPSPHIADTGDKGQIDDKTNGRHVVPVMGGLGFLLETDILQDLSGACSFTSAFWKHLFFCPHLSRL